MHCIFFETSTDTFFTEIAGKYWKAVLIHLIKESPSFKLAGYRRMDITKVNDFIVKNRDILKFFNCSLVLDYRTSSPACSDIPMLTSHQWKILKEEMEKTQRHFKQTLLNVSPDINFQINLQNLLQNARLSQLIEPDGGSKHSISVGSTDYSGYMKEIDFVYVHSSTGGSNYQTFKKGPVVLNPKIVDCTTSFI